MKKMISIIFTIFILIPIKSYADDSIIIKPIVGKCFGTIVLPNNKQPLKFSCTNKGGLYYLSRDNGRALFSFFIKTQDGTTQTIGFSGGKDFQPSLNEYILNVDTVRIGHDGSDVSSMEELDKKTIEFETIGNCKMNINSEATKIKKLTCDSNSNKGVKFNINLKNGKFIE